jgi:hypothetical protein
MRSARGDKASRRATQPGRERGLTQRQGVKWLDRGLGSTLCVNSWVLLDGISHQSRFDRVFFARFRIFLSASVAPFGSVLAKSRHFARRSEPRIAGVHVELVTSGSVFDFTV